MNVRFEALSRRLTRDVRRRRNHRHWTQFLSSKLKDALPPGHIGGPNGVPIMRIPPNARFGEATPNPAGAGGTSLPGRSSLPDVAEI